MWDGLTRDAGVPFTRCGSAECDCFWRAFDESVQHQLDRADLAYNQPLTLKPYAVAILRIGDAIVAPKLFPARIAGTFRTLLDPAKERLEGAMHPLTNVLQYLTV